MYVMPVFMYFQVKRKKEMTSIDIEWEEKPRTLGKAQSGSDSDKCTQKHTNTYVCIETRYMAIDTYVCVRMV